MSKRANQSIASAIVLTGAVALVGVLAVGCGDLGEIPASGANLETTVTMKIDGDAPVAGPGEDDGGGATDFDPSKIGTIKGRIVFDGTAPQLSFKETIAAGDASVCKPDLIGNEALVVGEGNGIQNVLVWLAKPPKGVPKPEGEGEAETQVFNNVNCRFVPHCLVVEVGETFELTSADATAHNTHTFPGAVGNTAVNTLVAKDQVIPLSYKKPEKLPVFVKCDLHAWMKAYHLVVPDKRYAAATKADGTFELSGLPHGKHQLTIWHESGIDQKVTVTVDADEVTFEKSYGSGDFSLAGMPRLREVVVSLGK